MAIELTNDDAADYLDSPETMAAYLNAAIEDSDGDAAAMAQASGAIARAGHVESGRACRARAPESLQGTVCKR